MRLPYHSLAFEAPASIVLATNAGSTEAAELSGPVKVATAAQPKGLGLHSVVQPPRTLWSRSTRAESPFRDHLCRLFLLAAPAMHAYASWIHLAAILYFL